jgi:hypothetical protein
MTTTIIWLGGILAFILTILGLIKADYYLLLCTVTIFVLIMIIGQLKDKISDLQKELERFKI